MPQVSQGWAPTEAMPTGLHFPVIPIPQAPPELHPCSPAVLPRQLWLEQPWQKKEHRQPWTLGYEGGTDEPGLAQDQRLSSDRHCSLHTAQLSQGVPYPRNLLGSSPFSSSHNWLLLRKQNLSIHCYLLTCLDSVFLLVTTEIPIFTSSASEQKRPGLAEIGHIFMNVRKTTFLTLAGWGKEWGE